MPGPRRSGRLLSWLAGIAFLACGGAFAANLALADLSPGNVWGLAYGTAAATLLVLGFAYSLRRWAVAGVTRRHLGGARSWLLLHMYGGALFLLLMLMHSGFHLPHGRLTWALWILSWCTTLGGLGGLALQRWLPKVLTALSTEIHYDRIPELTAELTARGQALVAATAEPLRSLAEGQVLPLLTGPRRRWSVLLGRLDDGTLKREFDYLRPLVGEGERQHLEELDDLYRTKLDIDAHYTVQQILRGWLALHVPLSILLLMLLVAHLGTVFYF